MGMLTNFKKILFPAKHFVSKDKLRMSGFEDKECEVIWLDQEWERRGEVGIQDAPTKKCKRLSREVKFEVEVPKGSEDEAKGALTEKLSTEELSPHTKTEELQDLADSYQGPEVISYFSNKYST
ncbi:hypothetical protein R1flu_009156 [Riccia fluitans]|uniref:Uncharacterized protein n=1 Tax=Riccia fluitans TaxID=41844 RepID=A0ABD1Z3T1_9MARC